MIKRVHVPVKRCLCEVCLTEWLMLTDQPPKFCRSLACRSRDWNGKKPHRRSRAQEISFPSPRVKGRPRTHTTFIEDSDDL
jgi:hypothetical protein